MPASAYFFFGEETYPAFEHLERLIHEMKSDPDQAPDVERFNLKTETWAEILDSARSMPLLFSSQRLILVQSPARKKPNTPSAYEEINDEDKKLISDYFSSPSSSTVMVIIFPGKVKRSSGLIRFFGSLGQNIQIKECKPYKDSQVYSWIKNRLKEEKKTISGEALRRLVELTGNDLGILNQELKKLSTFTGGDSRIDLTHVDEISGWGKEFTDFDITNELEAGNYRRSVLVIDRMLEKGNINPIQILNQIAGFLQNILLAKLRLIEGKKDRKAIFREIYPHISENWTDLYERKSNHLFRTADRLSLEEIRIQVKRLRRVDLKIKSTGLPFQPLIEEWIYLFVKQVHTVNRES